MTLVRDGVLRGAEVLWRKQWEGSPWASKMHLMTPASLAEYSEVAENVINAYLQRGAPQSLLVDKERLIEELRAERVELQSENEALRHDLKLVQEQKDRLEVEEINRLANYMMAHYATFPFEGSAVDFATQVMDAYRFHLPPDYQVPRPIPEESDLNEMAEALRPIKTEADIAALAQRVADLEDDRANMISVAKLRHRDVHSRIDSVAETIGNRIGQLFTEAREADSANGELMHSLQKRIIVLEDLAKTRGERLDSLEERQHQDDLDRAAGEGMAEPVPMEETLGQLSGIDGLDARLDAEARADEFPVVRPTHENGRQADTPPRLRVAINLGKDYGVGDWVKVSPCRSVGGHRDVLAGWYECVGIAPAPDDSAHVQEIQIKAPAVMPAATYALLWIADRCVIDASPTRPVEA